MISSEKMRLLGTKVPVLSNIYKLPTVAKSKEASRKVQIDSRRDEVYMCDMCDITPSVNDIG